MSPRLERSKTLALLSNHNNRSTSIVREFMAFRSIGMKHAVATGNQSSRTAYSNVQMSGSAKPITTTVQMPSVNEHWRDMWPNISRAVPQRGYMMCVMRPLWCRRSTVQQHLCRASHAWSLNLSSVNDCHMLVALGRHVVPWNSVR
jgi:hypothetical protein